MTLAHAGKGRFIEDGVRHDPSVGTSSESLRNFSTRYDEIVAMADGVFRRKKLAEKSAEIRVVESVSIGIVIPQRTPTGCVVHYSGDKRGS